MARLSGRAYRIGMSKDISSYCNCCFICQQTKAPTTCPALLQPVVASRPWELVVVDILKAPMSHRGEQYMLVVQDYFSKWPFAIPLSDQRADTTVYESSKIMCLPWWVYHDESPKGCTLIKEKLWELHPEWTLQDIWSDKVPHNSIPSHGWWSCWTNESVRIEPVV